jgi:hypothetical protein
MAKYLILSRSSASAFDDPKDFKALARDVSQKIKRECPGFSVQEIVTHRTQKSDIPDVAGTPERAKHKKLNATPATEANQRMRREF